MLTLFAMAAMAMHAGPTICIDPGHPSEVGVGTKGRRVSEVEIVWNVVADLKSLLERDGYRVVLTKASLNELVRNRRRAEIANESKAALLVRLHCDAAAGTGFAVYHPTRKGTSGTYEGPSKWVLEQSRLRAVPFHRAMAVGLEGELKDNGLKSDLQTFIGGKQGALTGSIFSHVPVVLVEMVVLTNPKDEAFITSLSGRRAMSEAIAAGVRSAVPIR